MGFLKLLLVLRMFCVYPRIGSLPSQSLKCFIYNLADPDCPFELSAAWSNTQTTFTSSFLAIFIAWFRISLTVDRLVAGAFIVADNQYILCCFFCISCIFRIFMVVNISLSQKLPYMIFSLAHLVIAAGLMLPSFSISESSGFWLFSVAEQTCLCPTSSKSMSVKESSQKYVRQSMLIFQLK